MVRFAFRSLSCVFTFRLYDANILFFSGVVAENGRLNKLENMFKAFATLMSAHRGELLCEITTAKVFSLLIYCKACAKI